MLILTSHRILRHHKTAFKWGYKVQRREVSFWGAIQFWGLSCPFLNFPPLFTYNHHLILLVGEGNGNPLQYSCLENPMDGGAWWAAVHGVAKSRTRRSDFTFTFHFHALEKEVATHSSVLAWRIPGMGKPGGLPSLGLHSWTRLKRLGSSSTLLVSSL